VVEDFDPAILLHGSSQPQLGDGEELDEGRPETNVLARRPVASGRAVDGGGKINKAKKQPKKIKYETSAARKAERVKQRARRTEKAERAGGKAGRKKNTTKRRR
jgi:ribosomal RNA-processing protein 17